MPRGQYKRSTKKAATVEVPLETKQRPFTENVARSVQQYWYINRIEKSLDAANASLLDMVGKLSSAEMSEYARRTGAGN